MRGKVKKYIVRTLEKEELFFTHSVILEILLLGAEGKNAFILGKKKCKRLRPLTSLM